MRNTLYIGGKDNCWRHVSRYLGRRVLFYEERRRGILRVPIRYYRLPVSSSHGWLELLCFTQVQRRGVLSSGGGISCGRFCTAAHGGSFVSVPCSVFNAAARRARDAAVVEKCPRHCSTSRSTNLKRGIRDYFECAGYPAEICETCPRDRTCTVVARGNSNLLACRGSSPFRGTTNHTPYRSLKRLRLLREGTTGTAIIGTRKIGTEKLERSRKRCSDRVLDNRNLANGRKGTVRH